MTKARDIASAIPAPSTVDATELGYLDGVTSAIQTQVDGKTAKATLTTTGDIYYASAANTPARLAIGSTSNVLTVAGGIPSWAAPAGGGKVLQVVMGTSTTTTTSTVSTYATTTLSASITPSSATSKVLVIYNLAGTQKSAATNAWFGVELRRAGTSIHILGIDILYENASLQVSPGMGSAYLDSPSTTSATTYEVFFKNPAATGTITVQRGGTDSVSTIILMEIGA